MCSENAGLLRIRKGRRKSVTNSMYGDTRQGAMAAKHQAALFVGISGVDGGRRGGNAPYIYWPMLEEILDKGNGISGNEADC